MKALIIEDETAAALNLAAVLRQVAPGVEVVATLESVAESVEWLRANPQPDLLFMDIHLADGDSFRIFKSVEVTAPVVFTTAYSEYAIDGFKLDAVDYLLKPFSFADFSRAAAKANSLYELRQGRLPAQPDSDSEATPKDREYISVKADYKVSLVRIADIVYIESEGEYVRMHLCDGSTIPTLFRLKNMEEALPS